MTVGQKASISVFTSLLVFSFLILISQSGLFSHLEKKIYSQVKVQEKNNYLTVISDECEAYADKIVSAICSGEDSFLRNRYSESYLKIDPSDYETANRKKLTENLFYQFPALEGVRLIDDRQNICFSTYTDTDLSDIEENRKAQNYIRYKNYEDVAGSEGLLTYYSFREENARHLTRKIILDSIRNQFVVAVRFQPSSLARNVGAIKAGTFVFYFDIGAFENILLEKRILNIGDKLIPVNPNVSGKNDNPFGFVVLSSLENQQDIKNAVSKNWISHEKKDVVDKYQLENLYGQTEDSSSVMLTVPSKDKYFHISGIYNSSIFAFSTELIALIYLCLFISLLLVIFLIFSFRADYSVVIKKRITRLQYEIINQYLENKASVDWSIVAEQIESKKGLLSEDIKKSFGKKGVRYSDQIDSLLNKSWSEIITVMKSSVEKSDESVLMNEIKKMLEEILNTGNLHYKAASSEMNRPVVVSQQQTSSDEELLELYDVEELEEYKQEEVETVIPENVRINGSEPSINGDSTIKIDPVVNNPDINQLIYSDDDDLAELMEKQEEQNYQVTEVIEELEAIEELPDVSNEIEDIEPLDEADAAENLSNDVEELEASIEELDEIDVLEDGDTVDDVEELDECEDLEEVAELEELNEEDSLHESAQLVDDLYEPTSNKNVIPHHKRYEYSNDTYTSGDLDVFPTVDNVFAEELCLGKEYTRRTFNTSNSSFGFVVKAPIFGKKNDKLINEDDLEELSDEITTLESADDKIDEKKDIDTSKDSEEKILDVVELNNPNTYTMTEFGVSAGTISDLSAANVDAIVEKNGIYSISENLIYTDIIQDEAFKSLVDSVLK